MTDRLSAAVAGGGIAGLASALALAQAGWQVMVLERAARIQEVGAGLGFTANGMTAARALGIEEAVRQAGYQTPHAGYQNPGGKWLLRIRDDHQKLAERTALWGIHRKRLLAVLLDAAQSAGVELRTGAVVCGTQPGVPEGEPAFVTWRDQTGEHTMRGDLVVGADGVRSAVREAVFPGCHARYAGSTSWRAVIPDSTFGGGLTEVWGPGTDFGVMRVSPSEIYWFGEFVHPAGAMFGDELAAARQHFAGWATWVQAIIAATEPDQLMRHDVYLLPSGSPRYTAGRVVLVGDAAHAMLPTAGQGAASALEDAVCVGRMIGMTATGDGQFAPALAAFDQARRTRCRWLAKQAARIGRFGFELGPGLRQDLRNAALRLVPGGIASSLGSRITGWTPPPESPQHL